MDQFLKATQPSLFLGATPAPARDYLQRVFAAARGKYTRVVVPCAGRFSGPLMALRAGFKPEQIEASDISLFSGLIGALVAGTDCRELGASTDIPYLPEINALVAIGGSAAEKPAGQGEQSG